MSDPVLQDLIDAVERTRADDQRQRDLPGASVTSLSVTRKALLDALENYAEALTSRSLPVPRQVRDAVRLLGAINGPVYDARRNRP